MTAQTRTIKLGNLARRAALAGLVTSVLLTGLLDEGFVAHAQAAARDARVVAAAADGRAAKTTAAGPGARKVATLQDAVDAKLLDPQVVATLAAEGAVDAFVQVDGSTVRRVARIEAPKGKGHAKAIVRAQRAGFEALKTQALDDVSGLTVTRRLPNLSTSVVRFKTARAILQVLRDPMVTAITKPRTGSLTLTESLAQIRQPEVKAAGNTGAGTYVAVIDTGVDYTRAAFGSCNAPGGTCKVADAVDFAPNDNALDDNGHGTNVSGIVLGVAPGAKVLNYDVFRVVGYDQNLKPVHSYDEQYIFAAFSRIAGLAATMPIASVNLSLGMTGTRNTSECPTLSNGATNPWVGELKNLINLNIAPVFAAGNNAAQNGRPVEGVSYPSCTPGAVRVGAVYDGNSGGWTYQSGTPYECTDQTSAVDKITCFSQNSRALLSVFAPGARIVAAGIPDSGTSQAAPHVAGAYAVLRGYRPAAPLGYLTSAIVNSGPLVGDARFGTAFYKHRLDLAAALAAVKSDSTAPAFTLTPRVGFAPGAILGTDGSIAVDTDWSATDANGIASYAIQISVNGGAWVDKTSALASPTSTKLTFTGMKPGTQYWIQVAARDKAGNWTGWQVLGPFKVYVVDQTSTTITRTAGWGTGAWTSAYGGSLAIASTAGERITYTIPARSIAVVGTSANNRGAATVKVNSLAAVSANEYAPSTTARRIQYTVSGLNVATQSTLTVTVNGTVGIPAFDVDAILVIQ